ncbi:Endoribonuclease YbeY [Candidatus Magnetomoraceae bacterium gMMP-15]
MKILIENKQDTYYLNKQKIETQAGIILKSLDCPDGELSIVFVDDLQIEIINKQYLNRTGPTNVIAFAMQEGEFSHIAPNLLGDVIISTDTASREGKSAGINMETRLSELLIHGILHLFGYDHEKSDEEEERMNQKSQELLTKILS